MAESNSTPSLTHNDKHPPFSESEAGDQATSFVEESYLGRGDDRDCCGFLLTIEEIVVDPSLPLMVNHQSLDVLM